MPDRSLLDAYLERLDSSLPLPDAERASAVEEIAAHVTMAADALVAGGMSRDDAERRALERIGAPDRLADDIAAAHRTPANMLAAAGTGLRVSLVTTIKTFAVAWAGSVILVLTVWTGINSLYRLVGSDFFNTSWSPLVDGFGAAVILSLIAFAVGRAVVGPVARAARHRPSDVRIPLLVIGVATTVVVGLTMIEARWTLGTAALIAMTPMWYALGVIRPDLVPAWRAPRRSFLALATVLFIGSGAILFIGGAGATNSISWADVSDSNEEYASVGPFVDREDPPLELDFESTSSGPWDGTGPFVVERSGTFIHGVTGKWTDLRLEVWPGPVGPLNGPALDPTATEPLATAPMAIDGRRIRGEVHVAPRPDRQHYYVTITGLDADGARWQLAWPDVEDWYWHGTALEWLRASWR